MAYKLIEAAQTRWRAVNAPHLVALVRAGAVFHEGKLLERPVDITPTEPEKSPETDRVGVVRCDGHVAGADRGNPFQRVFEVTDTVPSPLLLT
jgi:hypothetical protein